MIKDVDIFDNSEGWKLIGPKTYQDFDPFIFFPKKNTPIKRNNVNKKKNEEKYL